MDPAKLKVVELRAELSQRGLDTKGNKAVLVERLRNALDEETEGNETRDTVLKSDDADVDNNSTTLEQREKTPEPAKSLQSPKTPGRVARSTSTTTPVKTSSRAGSRSTQRVSSPGTQESSQKTSLNDQQVVLSDHKEPSSESIEASPLETEVTLESESEKKSESAVEAPISEPETIENNVDLSVESTNSKELTSSCENESGVTEEPSIPKNVSLTTEEPLDNSDQQDENFSETVTLSTECPVRTPKDESKDSSLVTSEPLIVEKTTDLLSVSTQPLQENSETLKTMEKDEHIDSIKPQEEVIEPKEEPKIEPEPEFKEEHEEETILKSEKSPSIKEDVDTPIKMESERTLTDDGDAETDNSVKIAEVKVEIDDANENRVKPEVEDVEMKEAKFEEDSDASMDRDRKERKDRKRKRSISPQQDRQRSPGPVPDDEPEIDDDAVLLSWYDSDLNLNINKDGFLSATPMHNDGFGYIWAGTRASFGFNNGKVYYEVKITENCPTNVQDDEHPHVLRAGWSTGTTSTQLGEEKLSYGFGGTGKISTDCKFQDYGIPFGKDDVVGCYADMTDETTVVLSFAVNGENQGVAFSIPKIELNGAALFPHILSKNCAFCCNFSGEDPWSKPILEGYIPVGSVNLKDRICGARRPEKKEDCEIIMMCGLPAAGKTCWAINYVAKHPEKMYNILGTNTLIDKMKVMGLPRKRNYHGRWEVLIDKCGRALNKLLDMASTRRRNYILDQTNVYPSARRRKMRHFYGFQRKAIVIVPTDDEFKLRTAKREAIEGKDIPDSAVLEMKENFTLPTVGETFDSVEFVELGEEEAKKLIEKYNKEGKEAGQHFANKRPRFDRGDSHRESRDSRNSRDSRDSRDYRDRRGGYPDRTRNTSGWRGSGNNGVGWRDRPQRGGNGGGSGHPRHSGGYGPPSSGGWRGRGGPPPQSSHRSRNDRRGGSNSASSSAGNDRRPGGDRNRLQQRQGGGWGAMGYQSSQQQQSSSWGGQQGSWSGSQSQQGWGQQGGWGQQQWGGWKGFGQGTYGQASYGQQNYGNGNWGGWNQQYYNQYWGQQQQQQQSGQSTIAGGQITTTTGATTTTNSSPTYGYAQGWQGYAHTYTFPGNTSTTNTQDQQSQQQK